MSTYQYKARNQRGELLEGSIESTSTQAVAQWMQESRLFPVSISLQKAPAETPPWLAKLLGQGAIKPEDVVMFTRQMASMTKAGLPLLQSITGLEKAQSNKSFAQVLKAIGEDLDKGTNLSQALARHQAIFGDYYLSMIRVGEDSGQLDQVFAALLRQLEFDRDMKKRIRSAVRYPTFVLGAISIAMGILTVFVIPVFGKAYKTMKVELPLVTRILMAASDFAVAYWPLVLVGVGLGMYGFKAWRTTPEGRLVWDRFKLRFPILGPIQAKGAIGRFCESFSTAYRAGVPIAHALTLVSKVVDNAHYEARILEMREGLERGENLSKLARSSGIFNATELQMIDVGEQTGEVDVMLGQMATMYQDDVSYEVGRLSESIEPILLGFMGVLVGVLLMGIFMPLWDMGQMASPKG